MGNIAFKLAFKFFRAKRKSLARFTSVVAVVGIAVGVASLIAAQSLARGFQDEMRDKILTNTAHISIFRTDGAEIGNWQTVRERIGAVKNINSIAPAGFANAVITTERTNEYALLYAAAKDKSPPMNQLLPNRNNRKITVAVGRELARKANLKIGDEADIITFERQNAPQTTTVLIAEISETGLYEYDSTRIFVSPENFAALNGRDYFAPTLLDVSLDDIYAANVTTAEIQNILGADFRALSWQKANQPLFAALSLERKVSLAIISLIIFVAVLNITTTLALLINERKADIAVLRTCGAQTRDLIFIFLFEGLLLGAIGIFFGLVAGLATCFLGNSFQFIRLNAEVYSLSSIPFHPSFADTFLIVGIAFALCVTATIFPASRAARIKPLENLRVR